MNKLWKMYKLVNSKCYSISYLNNKILRLSKCYQIYPVSYSINNTYYL